MNDVFKILNDLGFNINNDLKSYYNKIDFWRYYWKGYDPKFHEYQTTNVQKLPIKLKRKSLKMAKKVSEDWASLLLNDKTLINIDDETTQKLLTGDAVEQQDGVIGSSKFWKQGNRTVEKAYALGTAVFFIDLVNPKVDNDLRAENVRINYIKDPKQFIPLGWDNDEITECALFSYKAIAGNEYIYLQTMTIESDNRYLISNYYYRKSGTTYERCDLPNDMAEWYILPCKPFFVLTPNVENNYLDDIPMGVSIYANAIDCLQLCDIAFDNFYTDFYLGRKKIFMDQDLMATQQVTTRDESGNQKVVTIPMAGESLDQSLYVSTGYATPGEKKMFEEYNPAIRVNENRDGIQFALNLLSSKVGFGQNKYQFQIQNMATATQVKVSNKDQTESIWKQRIQVNDLLIELVKNIIVIQKELCGLPVNTEAKISIKFDDTMFTDEEAERMKDLNDVNAGLMAKWEYRVKWYGEDDESAKKHIEEITSTSKGIAGSYDGDEE